MNWGNLWNEQMNIRIPGNAKVFIEPENYQDYVSMWTSKQTEKHVKIRFGSSRKFNFQFDPSKARIFRLIWWKPCVIINKLFEVRRDRERVGLMKNKISSSLLAYNNKKIKSAFWYLEDFARNSKFGNFEMKPISCFISCGYCYCYERLMRNFYLLCFVSCKILSVNSFLIVR